MTSNESSAPMPSTPSRRPRAARDALPPWLAVAGVLLVLVGQVGFAVVAARLAAGPVAFAVPALLRLPPLPEPGPGKRPSLDGSVEPLPLVVRDLPDPSSRLAVDAYDHATLLHPQGAADMFQHAWEGLVAKAGDTDADAIAKPGGVLVWVDEGSMDAEAALYPPPSATDQQEAYTFESLVGPALAALSSDPRNADRLNNAAVALLWLDVSRDASRSVLATRATLGGVDLSSAAGIGQFPYRALQLLAQTAEVFPTNRAVLLNLAYVTSLAPASNWSIDQGIVPVARRLDAAGDDRTARFLLGSLQAWQADAADGVDRAVATLTALAEDPATAPLSHAALGDAYLDAASFREIAAPYAAAQLVLRALTEYDLALTGTSDPGVYAGRAASLAFLADHGGTSGMLAARDHASDTSGSNPDALAGAPHSLDRISLPEHEPRMLLGETPRFSLRVKLRGEIDVELRALPRSRK